MPLRALSLSLLLVSACAAKQSAEPRDATPPSAEAKAKPEVTALTGEVFGHDGKPVALAHVRLLVPGSDEPSVTKVGADGRFELRTHLTGLALLEVTGVDHAQLRVPIVVSQKATNLSVMLGTYARATDFSRVGLLVWTGDPGRSPPKRIAFAQADGGTLVASHEVKVDEVFAQLEGFTNAGRTINTPSASRYEYDGGGDYRSVLPVSKGRLEVRLDPAQAVPGGRAPAIAFADPQSAAAAVVAVHMDLAERMDAREQAALEAMQRDPASLAAFMESYDWSPVRADVLGALDRTTDPVARRAMLGMYFGLGPFPETVTSEDRARAKELLGEMDGGDPTWSLFPSALALAVRLSGDPAKRERFEAMLRDELPVQIAAQLVLDRLIKATSDGNAEDARRWFALMKSERLRAAPFARLADQFDPDRPVQKGKPVPTFTFGSLPDKKGNALRTIAPEDLQGKVVLLDFWATWCKPCVADMPHLHAAYERYGVGGKRGKKRKSGPKFEILSVSVDGAGDVVHAFRKDKFPMPWQHAWAPIGEASKAFGFTGIPFAVLIDEKGKILAATPQLSGATLEKTLQQVLGD